VDDVRRPSGQCEAEFRMRNQRVGSHYCSAGATTQLSKKCARGFRAKMVWYPGLSPAGFTMSPSARALGKIGVRGVRGLLVGDPGLTLADTRGWRWQTPGAYAGRHPGLTPPGFTMSPSSRALEAVKMGFRPAPAMAVMMCRGLGQAGRPRKLGRRAVNIRSFDDWSDGRPE